MHDQFYAASVRVNRMSDNVLESSPVVLLVRNWELPRYRRLTLETDRISYHLESSQHPHNIQIAFPDVVKKTPIQRKSNSWND